MVVMGEESKGQLSQRFSSHAAPGYLAAQLRTLKEGPRFPAKLTATPPASPPLTLLTALDTRQDEKLHIQTKKLSAGVSGICFKSGYAHKVDSGGHSRTCWNPWWTDAAISV